jgi:hypothetical protein
VSIALGLVVFVGGGVRDFDVVGEEGPIDSLGRMGHVYSSTEVCLL